MKKDTKNTKSTKSTNLKSRDRLILAIIVIAIVIAVVVCLVVANGNESNNDNNNNAQGSNQQTQTETENTNDTLDGQIDYTKTENVDIKNNVKENNSKALLKEKQFEGMTVKDIKLTASNGTTKFVATVENTSSTDFKNQKIVIVFKNEDGSEFARLDSYLGDIKVGASAEIDATTTSDLSNAYDFVIEKGA